MNQIKFKSYEGGMRSILPSSGEAGTVRQEQILSPRQSGYRTHPECSRQPSPCSRGMPVPVGPERGMERQDFKLTAQVTALLISYRLFSLLS